MSEPLKPQFQVTTGRVQGGDNRRVVVVMMHNATIHELGSGKLVPMVGLEVDTALAMAEQLTKCVGKIVDSTKKGKR